MSLLSIHNVRKVYPGVTALAAASADFDEGELVSIIGPNGAGKSTLFGALAGEHAVTGGSIEFEGVDITGWDANRRARAGISRTFQVARQFSTFTVLENLLVSFQAGRGEWWRPWRNFIVHRIPAEVEHLIGPARLEPLLDRPASTLPQGDRKRLELAMALAQRPKVLLLDEPTAGMTEEDSSITVDMLRRSAEDNPKMCMILAAHDMSVVFALAARIILMGEGRILLDGSPELVAGHSLTRLTYLGEE